MREVVLSGGVFIWDDFWLRTGIDTLSAGFLVALGALRCVCAIREAAAWLAVAIISAFSEKIFGFGHPELFIDFKNQFSIFLEIFQIDLWLFL